MAPAQQRSPFVERSSNPFSCSSPNRPARPCPGPRKTVIRGPAAEHTPRRKHGRDEGLQSHRAAYASVPSAGHARRALNSFGCRERNVAERLRGGKGAAIVEDRPTDAKQPRGSRRRYRPHDPRCRRSSGRFSGTARRSALWRVHLRALAGDVNVQGSSAVVEVVSGAA